MCIDARYAIRFDFGSTNQSLVYHVILLKLGRHVSVEF